MIQQMVKTTAIRTDRTWRNIIQFRNSSES
uniref:Uncharacterized protein n=1 Tax=Arundo donax TaxID=35708 RepID=A0A0A9GNQ1_ARUDO